MKKLTELTPQQFAAFKKSKNGNFNIPEEMVIYIKETIEERKANRITELEQELTKLSEPTEQELIEQARIMHPFYMLKYELESLKE